MRKGGKVSVSSLAYLFMYIFLVRTQNGQNICEINCNFGSQIERVHIKYSDKRMRASITLIS